MFGIISQDASSLEIAFWCSAIFGTLFFILKAITMLIGGLDHSFDTDFDADLDLDHGDVSHGHASDVAFKLISVQGLTGFFMMFGWVGLACLVQFRWHEAIAILLALMAGFGTMVIVSYLFKLSHKLISPGAQFSVTELIGKSGTVYERIPEEGKGRIQIGGSGITREIDAVSEGSVSISSSTTVEVVRVVDEQTVAVKAV